MGPNALVTLRTSSARGVSGIDAPTPLVAVTVEPGTASDA
jgi:hypothetical protein